MTSVCTASNCGGCGTKTFWSSVLFEQYATKAFDWITVPDWLADNDDAAPVIVAEDMSFVVIMVPVFRAVTVSVGSRMLSIASSSKLTKSVPEIDENRDK